MSFKDIEESGIRASLANEAVVRRELDREAAVVGIGVASRWAGRWKANQVCMVT
jgi:hypothetical protein